jgi:hypothetical protein
MPVHSTREECPWCEQAIPHEKFAEISRRIESRERDRFADMTARLKEQFTREKADAEAAAKAELEQVRKDGATSIEKLRAEAVAREEIVRDQARKAAELVAQEKLVVADRARKESETALRARLSDADQAKAIAEQASAQLKEQLALTQKTGTETVENLRREMVDKEATAHAEGRKVAEAAMLERLAQAEQRKAEAIADGQARVIQIEQQMQMLKEGQEATINERVLEARSALEKDKATAVLAAEAKAFADKQKFQDKLDDLQRQVARKRADELGEGAELDLFEELKAAFEGDRIVRVKKGVSGADVIHDLMHNGKVCGRIVYDSKNRNSWKNEYATKLREDQIAAKAEHAILSTFKFPSGARELCLQDGVIVAGPARVVAIAELIRRHVMQIHTLRLSNEERAKKTETLYAFVVSERYRQFLDSIETQVNKLLDIDVGEQNGHKLIWEKRGKLLKVLLKAQGDLCCEIERIIGTADEVEGSS